ncbi:TPA: hypothetical protein EYP66_02905 [Candidatus Poribacteria bacterium]|nr:hypothetical protein [Candidatus Poribacteria bacterium]
MAQEGAEELSGCLSLPPAREELLPQVSPLRALHADKYESDERSYNPESFSNEASGFAYAPTLREVSPANSLNWDAHVAELMSLRKLAQIARNFFQRAFSFLGGF